MKKQIPLLAFALTLITTGNSQSQTAPWLRYTVKGEEFSVMKDGKPISMWMQLEYNFNLY